ncbi:hypothetical protein LINPERPRIM_LOCUS13747 [Linum perenne]
MESNSRRVPLFTCIVLIVGLASVLVAAEALVPSPEKIKACNDMCQRLGKSDGDYVLFDDGVALCCCVKYFDNCYPF